MSRAKTFLGLSGAATFALLTLVPSILVAQDASKRDVESYTKRVLAAAANAGAGNFVNPKVEPGKVKWHSSFDAACEAAKKSGRPVLLFQMMGNLDEQFC